MPNKQMCQIDGIKIFNRFDLFLFFFALQVFGYGNKFSLMTDVAFTKIRSKIKINCLLSNPFTLILGVRQGSPLLILLYIIAAEVLAHFND